MTVGRLQPTNAIYSKLCLLIEVGISGYANLWTMSTDKWTNSVYFRQKYGSNCSFCLKTQFWGPLTENLNPLISKAKLAEAKPSFRKVSLPPAKLRMLFPAYLWVRKFWPQIYSLWRALDGGLLSNILASTKMGGA